MAKKVKITNGASTLTVSRKAFDNIYSGKGFTIVGEAEAEALGHNGPQKTSTKKATKKGAKKTGAKSGATKGNKAAQEEKAPPVPAEEG